MKKLNTPSSTETEMVSMHDILTNVLFTCLFLKDQGYGNTDTVIYQDKNSPILYENNGKFSSMKMIKHMNIRYLYANNMACKKEIRAEHFPKQYMIADFFTKPLNGAIFKRFRDLFLNVRPTTAIAA